MAKVSTNVSIDADIKKQAQELFAELGMDLSTAINVFLRQALRQRSLRSCSHEISSKTYFEISKGLEAHIKTRLSNPTY